MYSIHTRSVYRKIGSCCKIAKRIGNSLNLEGPVSSLLFENGRFYITSSNASNGLMTFYFSQTRNNVLGKEEGIERNALLQIVNES